MVELTVGDLYDRCANTKDKAVIHPEVLYQCKFCPMFKISGDSLRDTDRGRTHAAAHRIAFEALLEPSPVLICPICDLPQKTSDIACIFGCMFNDLDLVEHLENDHVDILVDDMVCDFSDLRYLLTTFQEQRAPSNSRHNSGEHTNVSGGNVDIVPIIDLSAAEDGSGSDDETVSDRRSGSETNLTPYGSPTNYGSTCATTADGNTILDEEPVRSDVVRIAMDTEQDWNLDVGASRNEVSYIYVDEELHSAESNIVPFPKKWGDSCCKQMYGVSVITCLVCAWAPSGVDNSCHMRVELSTHVLHHLREESMKLASSSNSFRADKRLLNCMDFSLEEYFEKEHLSDLSGTINSRIMGRVYSDLLTKLFGICVPLVYRILHGNNGNPFRSLDAIRKRVKKVRSFFTSRSSMGKLARPKRTCSNSTDSTESSDADSNIEESSDNPTSSNLESDQHIQCAREECGHSLLIVADRMAIVRHIAAHIRHDEMRLLNRTVPSAVVACDCGVAVGSAMGYIYHIVHDHVFERRKFSDIAATILSYITLIVEVAIESVLAVRVSFRTTKWSLWCAYFCLENDEGDESLFADSTNLNERWLKLWEDLIDEHTTGKNMSLGDTIRLFEMHPFIDEDHQRTRRHKSFHILDAEALYRTLSLVWRRLNRWEKDPLHRTQLASESRWKRLAQIRKKVALEAKKVDLLKDIWNGVTAEVKRSSHLLHVRDLSSINQDYESPTDTVDNEIRQTSESLPGLVVISSSDSGEIFQEETGSSDLDGKVIFCSICTNVCISAVNTAAIKDHCAFHAVMEGRMLCSLYIHRTADRPQICPFCHSEINVYKPVLFLHHLQCYHSEKARIIYDRYLFQYFPPSKIFCEPGFPLGVSLNESVCDSDYRIGCSRHGCCGVNPVVTLPHDRAVTVSDVDIAIVKHILWHVRNDSFLKLDAIERDLLTRALMVRLSSSQMRQVLFMAKRVTKQLNRYKEADVVKYMQAKMDEIGCILFGVNKGLVYQMVFTRRFVRDQSGMQLYPPCICRICVDKGLPRSKSDRRKRAFVAYAHPVVLHILEHLNAHQLPKEITIAAEIVNREVTCKLDGLCFQSVPLAIKHILDSHNDLVELSALDMVLEDMELFAIFRDAMYVVLGEQAWQLEEVLGFGGYKVKQCPKPSFLNDETGAHRVDCERTCDLSMCSCVETSSSQVEQADVQSDQSQYTKSRIRVVSLHGMPEASAACYEEFLHGPELHDNEEGSSVIAVAKEGSSTVSATSQESFVSPSNITTTAPSIVPSVTIKVEVCDELDDFDNRLATSPEGVSFTANFGSTTDLVSLINRTEQTRKKRLTKRLKPKPSVEMKREIDEFDHPQHKKALPLKNVIQGSKTVAAALVAALGSSGTGNDAGSGRGDTRNTNVQDDALSTSVTKFSDTRSSYSNHEDYANDATKSVEGTDFAFSNAPKKARLLISEDTETGSIKDNFARLHPTRRIRANFVHETTTSAAFTTDNK